MAEPAVVRIIDDDDAVRNSVGALLRAVGFIVRSYSSAKDYIAEGSFAEQEGCILTDLRMRDMTGLELLAELKTRAVMIPVILMSAYADVRTAVEALRLDAIEVLEKPIKAEELIAAVTAAMERARAAAKLREIQRDYASLTGREKEVVTWVAEGLSSKEVGRRLGISWRTVEIHRSHILLKMRCSGTVDLVNAIRRASLNIAYRARPMLIAPAQSQASRSLEGSEPSSSSGPHPHAPASCAQGWTPE